MRAYVFQQQQTSVTRIFCPCQPLVNGLPDRLRRQKRLFRHRAGVHPPLPRHHDHRRVSCARVQIPRTTTPRVATPGVIAHSVPRYLPQVRRFVRDGVVLTTRSDLPNAGESVHAQGA